MIVQIDRLYRGRFPRKDAGYSVEFILDELEEVVVQNRVVDNTEQILEGLSPLLRERRLYVKYNTHHRLDEKDFSLVNQLRDNGYVVSVRGNYL